MGHLGVILVRVVQWSGSSWGHPCQGGPVEWVILGSSLSGWSSGVGHLGVILVGVVQWSGSSMEMSQVQGVAHLILCMALASI